LNQQSHSESEVKEDDNETAGSLNAHDGAVDLRDASRRKKKKKKKKSCKVPSSNTRSSEDNIENIINNHPYHVDALLQLSDLCKLSDDLSMAAEFIQRALYSLECAFHPSFVIASGKCRLDYRRQENRSLYISLFKHMLSIGSRACYRTALEFAKLILSLDPEGDPLAIILAMDFYALRAQEYDWLLKMFNECEPTRNLSQLPNFAYSIAVAYFQRGDVEAAHAQLQKALIQFPGVLLALTEKCSVQVDSRILSSSFFTEPSIKQSKSLTQLETLYVARSYHVWKESELLPWLENNVHQVLDRVEAGDPLVEEWAGYRQTRYPATPRNILRHILLLDMKDVPVLTNEKRKEPIFGCSGSILTRSSGPLTGHTMLRLINFQTRYYYNDLPKSNPKLDSLIKRQETRPEVGTKLGSLLISPIQRVPRYRLLLKELISYASPSSPEYDNILEAIRLVETATEHINSLVSEQENMQRIIELQKSLCGGRPILVYPGRRLIKEGILMKVSKKCKKPQPRYFVLMSDVLMYCKMTGVPLGEPNSLRCSCVLPLRKCSVKQVLSDKVFNVSCLPLSLNLYSDEPYTSDGWIAALNQTIEQFASEMGHQQPRRAGYLSSIKKAISNFGQSIQKYWVPIYTGRETADRRITN
ncbi:unnamed protein product, partial [Nesidiocoris tenuis]